MKIYQIFTVFIFFVSFGGYCQSSAQDFDEELDSQKNKIESIKKEIERTKKRIIKEEKKEKTVARKVTILGELCKANFPKLRRNQRSLVGDFDW